MRNLKTFALLLLMAVCSMGVMAETAVLSWNLGENGTAATSANSITGAAGSAAEGWTIAITGNDTKNWSAGNGNITVGEVNYTTLKNSNGAQNTVTLPDGCAATHVTFYVTTNADEAGLLQEFNGATVNLPVTSMKDYANPTVIEQDLDYATSFTFTFNVKQVCFVAVVAYRVAEIDPADVFTFGLTSEIVGTEIQSVGTLASGCSHVETSALQTTYQTLTNRTLYHGSADAFSAPVAHRNMNLNSVVIKTQNGEADGAENHGAYMAFTLNIKEDYLLNLREISSDLYVDAKSKWYYEYVIEKGGVELYKSPVQTIASGQSGTDHSNSIATLRWDENLQGLTGEITVKLIWWINSSATMLALKDFNVTAALKTSDNPHVEFGMGREFADATHFEEGVEKLIGSAPAPLAVALHNGSGLDETTTGKALYHGTSENAVTAPTSYRNKCHATQEVADGVFLNNLYWGFSVDIPIGYSMSISQLYGDFYAEKNKIQYKMGVYTSDADDAEPLFMSAVKEGNITTMGDVAMTVNTAEVAALQNLQGKIYLRFYWNIESSAAYAALKDFKIRALIEPVPGEGVKGLVFTDFEASKNPTFTEGEVTAVWSNTANNVAPDAQSRGIRVQAGYDYTMQLTVPADSYISEVVFVWNSKGNKIPGTNDDYFIDFTVKNSSDVTVSSLQQGTKEDETVWSCGELRESELKFMQGAGDFYCHSIRVTYLPKPTVQQYVRTHTHMNLNTLCFPYQIDSYTGASFYTMLYKAGGTAAEPAEIYLQEHVGALEAGKPYFYVPEGTELVCNYSGEYTAAGNDGNGTYGVYADMTDVTPGMYVTYNNLFTKAGSNVQLREYRAYVDMNEVSVDQQGPSYVPGRRVLRVSNANAPSSATDIENTSAKFGGSEKILENGVLYIIKNGAKYNAQGQMVK
ncbi:MAG: hypothetical protein IJ249_03630 [Paludibacteraceae bacterium]|nr:hypothetical protein [Paludibacteraceae bacterium]